MDNFKEPSEILPLGITDFRDTNVTFGIKPEDRMRHMYLIGKTGVGKTTLMQNMITEDLKSGRGLCIIDPHNDFAERSLGLIPKSRINDAIYFNPADIDYPFSFNIMEAEDDIRKKSLIASSVVGTFKKIFAESWGPRLEYLLRNTIFALLDSPGNTLLGVPRLLVDKSFRKRIVKHIKDPVVKSFWEDEYTKYNQSFQVEAISPIQNKIGQFLSSELSRNIFGQSKSSIDLKEVMDNRKILICNFSKGRIGEDYSQFLGAMMITKLQITAMERAEVLESDRVPFYLYVDEFQNFVSESFAAILSEARKFKLSLTIAHQYLEQLGEEIQAAVLGNVGTIICFRVGAEDAQVLAKEFSPQFGFDDLVNLDQGRIYIKLMIDGMISKAFSAKTKPYTLGDGDPQARDKVIKVSRERYGKSRAEIQEKIKRWMGYEDKEIRTRKSSKVVMAKRKEPEEGEGSSGTASRKNYPPVKSMSLSEAMSSTPRDFRGRPVRKSDNRDDFEKVDKKSSDPSDNDSKLSTSSEKEIDNKKNSFNFI